MTAAPTWDGPKLGDWVVPTFGGIARLVVDVDGTNLVRTEYLLLRTPIEEVWNKLYLRPAMNDEIPK